MNQLLSFLSTSRSGHAESSDNAKEPRVGQRTSQICAASLARKAWSRSRRRHFHIDPWNSWNLQGPDGVAVPQQNQRDRRQTFGFADTPKTCPEVSAWNVSGTHSEPRSFRLRKESFDLQNLQSEVTACTDDGEAFKSQVRTVHFFQLSQSKPLVVSASLGASRKASYKTSLKTSTVKTFEIVFK